MKTLLLSFAMLFLFFNSWSLPTIPIDSLEKRLNVVEMELKVLKTVPNFSDEDVLIQNLQGKATKQIKIIKNKEIRNNVIKQLPLSHKILVLSPLFTVFLMMLLLCISLKEPVLAYAKLFLLKKQPPTDKFPFILLQVSFLLY